MNGREHVGGRVGAVQIPHRLGEHIGAGHIPGAQIHPVGHHRTEQQRQSHADEQRQAQPPEIPAGRSEQQKEEGAGNPEKPQIVRDDGILAEGDQIIQRAVQDQVRDQHGFFQQKEKRKIEYQIPGHKTDRVISEPAAHNKLLFSPHQIPLTIDHIILPSGEENKPETSQGFGKGGVDFWRV